MPFLNNSSASLSGESVAYYNRTDDLSVAADGIATTFNIVPFVSGTLRVWQGGVLQYPGQSPAIIVPNAAGGSFTYTPAPTGELVVSYIRT